METNILNLFNSIEITNVADAILLVCIISIMVCIICACFMCVIMRQFNKTKKNTRKVYPV